MGKSEQIDYYYHWLNVVAISLIALASFVEFLNLESESHGLSFTLSLLRSYFLLVQSTWFIQIGFDLFLLGTTTTGNEMQHGIHGRLMNLTSGFSMHLFSNVIVVLIVSWAGQRRARRICSNVLNKFIDDSSYSKLIIEHENDQILI